MSTEAERVLDRARVRRYREANRATTISRSRRRGQATRAYYQAIKLERGCVDCGYRAHPEALHFDHRPGFGKFRPLSQMQTYSRERIDAELAKCDVRCANCHAVKTAERRDG